MKTRLLALSGKDGTVFCRVIDSKTAGTLPRLSENQTIENATRSWRRMVNLTVFRGHQHTSMIGPGDYFGNLEKPDQSAVTFNIQAGIVNIEHHPKPATTAQASHKITEQQTQRVTARWLTGQSKAFKETLKQYKNPFGNSLFPNPGLLEIESNQDTVVLPTFDATQFDLSPFKARLVSNTQPFMITEEALPSSDEFRPVSYNFGEEYAQDVIKHGGGLFLETHDFTQTMTPLDENAAGFITLGKWNNDDKTQLDLIAVKVPYGHTLIVESGCIHGDTTFKGMYMMAMTSNHRTMNTADTVFLKNPNTRNNITLVTAEEATARATPVAAKPFYLPYNPTTFQLKAFIRETNGHNFIFQPFNLPLWNVTVYRRLKYNPGITLKKCLSALLIAVLTFAACSSIAPYIIAGINLSTSIPVIAIGSFALFVTLLLTPCLRSRKSKLATSITLPVLTFSACSIIAPHVVAAINLSTTFSVIAIASFALFTTLQLIIPVEPLTEDLSHPSALGQSTSPERLAADRAKEAPPKPQKPSPVTVVAQELHSLQPSIT